MWLMAILLSVLSMTIRTGERQMSVYVHVPVGAVAVAVVVECEHSQSESSRPTDGGGQEVFEFRGLHGDSYTVGAAVRMETGKVETITREVFVGG